MKNIIYGVHAVKSAIRAGSVESIIFVSRDDFQHKEITKLAKKQKLEIKNYKTLEQGELQKYAQENHQGIFAIEQEQGVNNNVFAEDSINNLLPEDKNALILILDNVQDPHNFGACIRSAHSAGVDFIMVPKDNSAPLNATVKKVACGAAEHMPIVVVTNLSRAIEKLKKKNIWVVGLAGEADEYLYNMDLADSVAIVLGSEGSGMRQKTKSNCDFLAKIPMYGEVSSLNVSVATGISLYEAVRQRGFK